MLEAGGIEPLKDDIRVSDEDNPGGYYEFEPVKKTREDPSWLKRAPGKAVKMVSRLLLDLPSNLQYKVIFMRRVMDEILASQKRMLERHGRYGEEKATDEEIAALFAAHLQQMEEWLKHQPNFDVLYVQYNDLMQHPQEQINIIERFLGTSLDKERMVGIIDRSLYRQRK
jgi:hypothetical protein